jgi:RNA polymerase sigma-70 factor (ECF subfamily)
MGVDRTSPEGFEVIVREHQGMVFRTLARLTGSNGGEDVEDLAQEVFLRLYRALPEFRGDAMLSTYLYRIVVNVAQDAWKRRRRERSRLAAEPVFADEDEQGTWLENFAGEAWSEHARNPEQRMEDAQTQHAVDAALLRLPEMERAVLVLYHQEECSYEGIAAALAMPLNTVRTHLHRGRKRLGAMVNAGMERPALVAGIRRSA